MTVQRYVDTRGLHIITLLTEDDGLLMKVVDNIAMSSMQKVSL